MKLRANRRPGNRAMTKAERAHVDDVKRSGCGPCIDRGYLPDGDSVVEAHHHLLGGIRIGHLATEGLCVYHHRGVPFVEGWTLADHRLHLGPSMFLEAREFKRLFGPDAERLAAQNHRIKTREAQQ